MNIHISEFSDPERALAHLARCKTYAAIIDNVYIVGMLFVCVCVSVWLVAASIVAVAIRIGKA